MLFKNCSILFFLTVFCSAYALKIEINKGEPQPDPIAVVDFFYENGKTCPVGTEISEIIKNDLNLSGLFKIIDKSLFLESPKTLATKGHNINNWKPLDARFLAYGVIRENGSGFTISFKLVDIIAGNIMLSMDVSGNTSKLRKTAHIIADYIYERITNEAGYFNTQIIVVKSATQPGIKRTTKLVRMDQDGANPIDLTDGTELVLTARYSNDGRTIAFISYSDHGKDILGKSAHIYTMDLQTGRQNLLINKNMMKALIKKNNGNPVQMTYAPRFSKDGTKAVLAIIIDGKSAIYILDIPKNELKQLTQHNCIDTSPCFMYDDSKIVFTSNRAGPEAIYIMNADGTNQHRISKEGGKYSQPVCSPRGDLIAFTKITEGKFFIGLMKPDGTNERLIASAYLVEAPCWASNGRYIAYSCEADKKSRSKIGIVDITGNHMRIIESQGDATCPAWSPSLSFIRK